MERRGKGNREEGNVLRAFLHAKRSAVASRRWDLSPERSVLCQPQGVGHCYSRVSADLLSPNGRRSASGTPPVGTWPDTVLCFAAGLHEGSDLLVHRQPAWQRQVPGDNCFEVLREDIRLCMGHRSRSCGGGMSTPPVQLVGALYRRVYRP